jgi:hypothetical protein
MAPYLVDILFLIPDLRSIGILWKNGMDRTQKLQHDFCCIPFTFGYRCHETDKKSAGPLEPEAFCQYLEPYFWLTKGDVTVLTEVI